MKIATWTAFCLQLIAMAPFVQAESPPTSHECELEEEKDEIKFKCKTKTENDVDNTELKDEIKFKVKMDDDILKVKVEYEQEIETYEMEAETENMYEVETESETQYEVEFDRLVEYKKSNSSTLDQGYDFEEDIVVKETKLVFGSFSDVEEMDGKYQFSISSTDGVATFTFKISTGGENSTDVLANTMKIDFELFDYEWTEMDTEIALVSSLETKREIEVEYEHYDGDEEEDEQEEDIAVSQITGPEERNLNGENVEDHGDGKKKKKKSKMTTDVRISFEEALNVTGINVFGEYSWATDAIASTNETSQTIDVIATSPGWVEGNEDGETVQIIAFSFVNAGGAMDIFWDPSVGVNYGDDSVNGNSSLFGSVGALVAGVVVAAIACLVVVKYVVGMNTDSSSSVSKAPLMDVEKASSPTPQEQSKGTIA